MLMLAIDAKTLTARHDVEDHWSRLLGKYDPLLLAHKTKDWLIDPSDQQQVWRSGGRVEAVVLADGRITGTWRYKRKRRTIDLTITTFAPPPAWLRQALRSEAERVGVHFRLEPGNVTVTTKESS